MASFLFVLLLLVLVLIFSYCFPSGSKSKSKSQSHPYPTLNTNQASRLPPIAQPAMFGTPSFTAAAQPVAREGCPAGPGWEEV